MSFSPCHNINPYMQNAAIYSPSDPIENIPPQLESHLSINLEHLIITFQVELQEQITEKGPFLERDLLIFGYQPLIRETPYDPWSDTPIFNLERFILNLSECLEMISKRIPSKALESQRLTYIQKINLAKGSEISVRADLHGDLRGLLTYLEKLQTEGFLDANYKCIEDHQIVFLGDYMDRGKWGLQVLEVLAMLKAYNPDNVHLIRGNHDHINFNLSEVEKYSSAESCYSIAPKRLHDHNVASFLESVENRDLLQGFYNTMPSILYIGTGVKAEEYALFTHGLYDINIDPKELLNDREREYLVVERIPTTLNPRIARLFEKYPKDLCFYEESLLNTTSKTPLHEIKMIHEAIAVKRISIVFEKSQESLYGEIDASSIENPGIVSSFMYVDEKPEITCYLSGDCPVFRLTPLEATAIARIAALTKLVFRGHQHLASSIKSAGGKVRINTLVWSENMTDVFFEEDRLIRKNQPVAYFLTIDDHVKDWKIDAIKFDTDSRRLLKTSRFTVRYVTKNHD